MWLAAVLISLVAAVLIHWYMQKSKEDDAAIVFSMLPETAQRAVRQKQKLKERFDNGNSVKRGGSESLPPGQYKASSWILLDLGFSLSEKYRDPSSGEYKITVTGLQEGDKSLTLADLQSLGIEEFTSIDWHCVTGWSALGLGPLYGIPIRKFIENLGPINSWSCMYQVSGDGYTTVIRREDLEDSDAFFAIFYQSPDQIIPHEHGGPRIVAPHLFGWKSAKYLTELHFLPTYKKGFWEKLGCHERGRVSLDERWDPKANSIWTVLKGITSMYKVFGYNTWVDVMQTGGRLLGYFAQKLS